jgi:hypothetical protein
MDTISMANLQIKGIDDSLYGEIKLLAMAENRSVSQQVLYLVKHWLSHQKRIQVSDTPAEVLLQLSGSWQDDSSADEIIAEIKTARRNSDKLSQGF